MPAPIVSVVVPTYNHAQFLGPALQSVRAQTLADWEAIVVNNYSDDNTVEVVAAFNDPRIRLVNFRNHGVIAASRNEGIRLAAGELVAFLDSDDSWHPRKLARCVEAMAGGFDLVCHGEDWTREGAPPRRMIYGPASRARYARLLFNGNCISTSAVVVRKQWLAQVGGFREEARFVTAEDYDLWLRLARDGARIGFVDEILGEYRMHGGNASKALLRHLEAELAVVNDHFSALAAPGPFAGLRIRRRRALVYYGAGRGFQAAGNPREAWRWFGRALRESPFILRLYAAALLNMIAPVRQLST
jgi:glycosyltransferase involved in cell wall biosynthesis